MSVLCKQARRGVALLLVLLALAICVTGVAALASKAARLSAQHASDRQAIMADDLLTATEAPILNWLVESSQSVVLPPDVDEPRVVVLRDQWRAGDHDHELSITAWDQCGMVPIELVGSGSPLRLGVPAEVLEVIDSSIASVGVRGIDQFDASTWPVFPAGDEQGRPSSRPAVGALIATHQNDTARLNVHTAPLALVEAGMRLAGRSGIEQIIRARAEGNQLAIGGLSAERRPFAQGPALVGVSDVWSFRIDIRIGALRRSWWAVYEHGSRRTTRGRGGVETTSGGWECAQRLVINN